MSVVSSKVLLAVEEGVARLTLNRPDNANVLDLDTAREFAAAVRRLRDDARIAAVVIGGAGKHFCFGGDLRGMIGTGAPVDAYLLELTALLHEGVQGLVALDAPVIAAVNGTAAGAGVGLVAMADLALCGESSRFNLAYTGVALTPDGSTSFFLPRLIGAKRAAELLFTNRMLSAQEALDWGLVNRVVPDAELEREASLLARRLAVGPRHAYAKTKRLLAASQAALAAQLDLEGRTIAAQAASPEGMEGMNAFLEKRPPRYL
jgi:2-(1,2-epoxy-1,2-dihydrophenyl)acetyl-CoA isomerase